MKKAILMFLGIAFCWGAHGENFHVIPVEHLTEKVLDELMEGRRPDVAVEFAAGSEIPVGFFLKGGLVQLKEGRVECGSVEFMQTVYARSVGGNLLFSSNLTDWKPLLTFITGNASVALSIEHNRPALLFGAEVNRRD